MTLEQLAKAKSLGFSDKQIANLTDTAPLPIGQSAIWKYRAIYHAGDARIGQWSETVSIPVAG